MSESQSELHQVLLWDTAADGTVSLSSSERALREKIIATHLLGGRVIVRPAELFEGEDFYFQSAVQEDGLLYQLMKAGHANLALSGGETIGSRAQWRFERERVVDRGAVVVSDRHLEEVRRRTFSRAEILQAIGWKPVAPDQQLKLEDNALRKRLNESFRSFLKSVGRIYLGSDCIEKSRMAEYVCTDRLVTTRSELHPDIDQSWWMDVEPHCKEAFIRACKDALTVAAYTNTANQYGGRISEFRPDTFRQFAYCSAHVAGQAELVELRIMQSFMEVFPEQLTPKELIQKKSLVTTINSLDAKGFVAAVEDLVSDNDRTALSELIYGISFDDDDNRSLAELASDPNHPLSDNDLKRVVRSRVKQMMDRDAGRMRRRRIVWETLAVTVGEALLLLLPVNIPFALTGGQVAYELYRSKAEEIPMVFGGFRRPLYGELQVQAAEILAPMAGVRPSNLNGANRRLHRGEKPCYFASHRLR